MNKKQGSGDVFFLPFFGHPVSFLPLSLLLKSRFSVQACIQGLALGCGRSQEGAFVFWSVSPEPIREPLFSGSVNITVDV